MQHKPNCRCIVSNSVVYAKNTRYLFRYLVFLFTPERTRKTKYKAPVEPCLPPVLTAATPYFAPQAQRQRVPFGVCLQISAFFVVRRKDGLEPFRRTTQNLFGARRSLSGSNSSVFSLLSQQKDSSLYTREPFRALTERPYIHNNKNTRRPFGLRVFRCNA